MTADWPTEDGPDETVVLAESPDPEPQTEPEPPRPSTRVPALALVPLAAVVWWVVGFLPWIVGGLGRDDLPGRRIVLVPLFAGNVSALVVGCGIGGLASGLVALLGRGSVVARAGAVAAGVAIAAVVVLAQSRSQLGGTDGRVLNGLTGVVVVMTVVALAVGLLALAGPAGLGIALAGVAGALPVWLLAVWAALDGDRAGTLQTADELARWAGAVVLAGALVMIGARPLLRLVWWPVAILLAWVVGPTVTAAVYIEPLLRPGMGLPGMLGDHVSASLDVWRLAASPDARPLTPWIVAIVAAAVIAAALDRRRATRSASSPA